jgi:hypothetical protein
MLGAGNKAISINNFYQDDFVSRSGIDNDEMQLVVRRLEEKNLLKVVNDEQVIIVHNNVNSS